MSNEASPFPEHWKEDFGEKADLESSFEQLSGHLHFYSDALRGRIRYYQMRYDEAWDWLDRAAEGADHAPSDIPNLVRRFFVSIYSFYTALAERPLAPSSNLPALQMPPLPADILESYPELGKVITSRQTAEAILRLHAGQPEEAVPIFRERIEQQHDNAGGEIVGDSAYNYIGLAAGLESLGENEEALVNLENAGYVVRAAGPTLTRARVSALLNGFYRYLDSPTEAEEWLEFLRSLPCPTETKETFEQRAERVLERCCARKRLLPL